MRSGPPEAQLCGASRVAVVGGGNSSGPGRGLALARRRARHAAPPPRRPARDDVRLPRPRARARAASPYATAPRSPRCTARTAYARSGHAEEWRAPAVLVPVPLPRRASVHRVARRRSAARRQRASSSPAPPRTPRTCWRRACLGSSPPATSARDPRSDAPQRSAKERWPCTSSTRDLARLEHAPH